MNEINKIEKCKMKVEERLNKISKEYTIKMLISFGVTAFSIAGIVYCVLTRRKIANTSNNSFLLALFEDDEAYAKIPKDALKYAVKHTKFWDDNYDSILTLTTLDKLGVFGEKLVEKFKNTTLDTAIALYACTESGFKEKK